MAPRPPSDAIVALRSLPRRFGGLFAGLAEDESPDDLAHRHGGQGRSALDEAAAATRTITFLDRALEQVLIDDDPVLHPGVLSTAERDWPAAEGTVEACIDDLARAAGQMADRADRVPAGDWARQARVAGHDGTVSAVDVLWDAVDSAVDHLKVAERTLAEVRRRPST